MRSSLLNSASFLIKTFLIWERAKLVLAILSHPSFGPLDVFDVLISTTSPVFKEVFNGTNEPLIIAPTALSPTPVWILYAKSSGVDPFGKSTTFPLGVNTYTLALKISWDNDSIYPLASVWSSPKLTKSLIQCNFSSISFCSALAL